MTGSYNRADDCPRFGLSIDIVNKWSSLRVELSMDMHLVVNFLVQMRCHDVLETASTGEWERPLLPVSPSR